MLSKVALFIAATLAASAMAAQCNRGPIQCCASLERPTSAAASKQLGLLGIPIETVTGHVGFDCKPTSVEMGAFNCATAPVCCEKNFEMPAGQHVGVDCFLAIFEI